MLLTFLAVSDYLIGQTANPLAAHGDYPVVSLTVEVRRNAVVKWCALPDDDDVGPFAMGAVVTVIPRRCAVDETPFYPLGRLLLDFTLLLFGASHNKNATVSSGIHGAFRLL